MENAQVLNSIKQVASQVLPKGSMLYLYGSRARGDAHEGSDWDLLLLLDKPRLEFEDFDKYSYPFVEMGWSGLMPIQKTNGLTDHIHYSIIMSRKIKRYFPYKERSRFEEFLLKIGFPISSLKKIVSKAAVF